MGFQQSTMSKCIPFRNARKPMQRTTRNCYMKSFKAGSTYVDITFPKMVTLNIGLIRFIFKKYKRHRDTSYQRRGTNIQSSGPRGDRRGHGISGLEQRAFCLALYGSANLRRCGDDTPRQDDFGFTAGAFAPILKDQASAVRFDDLPA